MANPTALPTKVYGAPSQQLRSRGIYTDEVLAALQNNLDNCFDNYLSATPVATPDNPNCFVKNVSSPLEMYPFFDVQLTKLARWTTTQLDDPVSVTNEELATDNTHSRGVASLAGSKVGGSVAHSLIEPGNVGLISTLPIALVPAATDSIADLYLAAGGVVTPPPPSGNPTISGTLNNEGGTSDAAVATIVGSGATCTKPTNLTFICTLDGVTANPTVTISNYYKNNASLIACSSLTMDTYAQGNNATANWTRFFLPTGTTTGVTITISKAPC